MGVITSHVASRFFIPKSSEKRALASLKAFLIETETAAKSFVHNPKQVLGAKNFVDALEFSAFRLTRNAQGDITSLEWAGDKLPDDTSNLRSLFASFAPYVKKGSYVAITEQEGPCKFTFDGTRVKRAHDEEPEDDESHSLFRDGARFARQSRVDDAVACFAKAIEGDQSDDQYYAREASEALLELLFTQKRWKDLEKWCAKAPPRSSSSHFAHYADSVDDPKVARALIEAGLKANPRDADCLWRKLEAHEKRDDFAQVITTARALKSNREWKARALSSEGSALYSLARYREALVALRAAVALEPRTQDVMAAADCLVALGRRDEARPLWAKALVLETKGAKGSDWAPTHAYRALVLARLGRLKEASTAIARAAAMRQDTPAFWVPYVRGQLSLERGDPAAALADHELALGASPDSEWAKLRVLQALAALGKDAKRVAKLAAELKKKSPDLSREVAIALKPAAARSPRG